MTPALIVAYVILGLIVAIVIGVQIPPRSTSDRILDLVFITAMWPALLLVMLVCWAADLAEGKQ